MRDYFFEMFKGAGNFLSSPFLGTSGDRIDKHFTIYLVHKVGT